MKANRIVDIVLADVAGVSRTYVRALRLAESEPTRLMMLWLVEAASYILRRPVEVEEMFDLTITLNPRLMQP